MKKIVALLAVACVCSLASALTYTDTVDWTELPDGTTVNLQLDKFDTTLGTLTGVTIEYYVRSTGAEVELDNDAAQAQVGTAKYVNTVVFSSAASTLDAGFTTWGGSDFSTNESQNFNLGGTTGDTVGTFDAQPGNADYAIWTPGVITEGGVREINSLVWSQYEGTGTYTVSFTSDMLTGATFSGSLGQFNGSSPAAEAFAKVTYTYVPEPATMALLGLGGLFIKRKRA